MKNYVLIYHNDHVEGGGDTGAAWGAWFGKIGGQLVDAGNPFAHGGKSVSKSGVSGATESAATGYTIVKADSLDDAVELTRDCPVLDAPGGSVEVFEALPM